MYRRKNLPHLPPPTLPFPHAFPTELEREIFESAALQRPEMIAKLRRVARRVLISSVTRPLLLSKTHAGGGRTEPLLYRNIRLAADSAAKTPSDIGLLRAVKLKPGGSASWTDDELRNVLSVCTGIVDLTVNGNVLPLVSHLRSTIMAVDGPYLPLTLPLFHTVTHLYITTAGRQLQPDWPPLWQLPALTHLSIQVLPIFSDPRVVRIMSTPSDDGFWARVDAFLEKKRTGEIDGEFSSLARRPESQNCPWHQRLVITWTPLKSSSSSQICVRNCDHDSPTVQPKSSPALHGPCYGAALAGPGVLLSLLALSTSLASPHALLPMAIGFAGMGLIFLRMYAIDYIAHHLLGAARSGSGGLDDDDGGVRQMYYSLPVIPRGIIFWEISYAVLVSSTHLLPLTETNWFILTARRLNIPLFHVPAVGSPSESNAQALKSRSTAGFAGRGDRGMCGSAHTVSSAFELVRFCCH
ncbi:hypothetical protein DFH09DRAFT_1070441 [Mycena vulgaris]|nr:hypothetical protein DFH09DRAFT_1070441 [Mycena vulgaris]